MLEDVIFTNEGDLVVSLCTMPVVSLCTMPVVSLCTGGETPGLSTPPRIGRSQSALAHPLADRPLW